MPAWAIALLAIALYGGVGIWAWNAIAAALGL